MDEVSQRGRRSIVIMRHCGVNGRWHIGQAPPAPSLHEAADMTWFPSRPCDRCVYISTGGRHMVGLHLHTMPGCPSWPWQSHDSHVLAHTASSLASCLSHREIIGSIQTLCNGVWQQKKSVFLETGKVWKKHALHSKKLTCYVLLWLHRLAWSNMIREQSQSVQYGVTQLLPLQLDLFYLPRILTAETQLLQILS